MAISGPVSPSDNMVKWGAASLFIIVVLGAGYLIYSQSQSLRKEIDTSDQSIASTPSVISAADKAAQGSPAPVVVATPSDLKAAEDSLDSSDIDSLNNDLDQNDADLASF
jgi:hypothetical protein